MAITTSPSSAQSKRYLWVISVLMAAVPGLAAIALMKTGNGFWSIAPVIFFFGIIPVLDTMFGEDPYNPHEDEIETLSGDQYFRILLFFAVAVFWLSFILAAIAVSSANIGLGGYIAMAFSAGVASGSALTVGHELGHRQGWLDGKMALIANALSGYGHFRIEHNRGHHVMVATPEDHASARLGESVWRFAFREIPGGIKRGWHHEKRRLEARNVGVFSLQNEILQGYAVTGTVALILISSLGLAVLPFILIHHLVAWLQLTFANYIEHYGLKRSKKSNGKYEACQPRHSWNSNHIVSNLSLFHLQRHSDHHANPNVPYQALRNFEGLPELPSGYPGCFVMAAIPPLWFSVMDKKAFAWAKGDPSLLNLAPHRESFYHAQAV